LFKHTANVLLYFQLQVLFPATAQINLDASTCFGYIF